MCRPCEMKWNEMKWAILFLAEYQNWPFCLHCCSKCHFSALKSENSERCVIELITTTTTRNGIMHATRVVPGPGILRKAVERDRDTRWNLLVFHFGRGCAVYNGFVLVFFSTGDPNKVGERFVYQEQGRENSKETFRPSGW